MKDLLTRLYKLQTLPYQEAKNILLEIGEGKHNYLQIASFLTVFNMRSLTTEELRGFRDAMLDLAVKIDLGEFDAVDIVGTGGDGKNTFNISTTASFVVAGAGYKIAKHGNYGVSSTSGSSNVLEYLGVSFTRNANQLKRQLEKSGFTILHAPLFHPAMKYVAPVRRELGVRTFFNILGPLINPAQPKKQLLGVYNLELARLYGHLYQQSTLTYSIVHSIDAYDEVSLTSPVKVISNQGEILLHPRNFGFKRIGQHELDGGKTVSEAASILVAVLKGESTEAQTNAVLANAALAIKTLNPSFSLEDSLSEAKESVESGRAYQSLNKFISSNNY
ncbi:anthranilate phosphoribosyltransferase [Desertivirga brevis]|uniref:anthranilate phosphoribosyltransferase n=1 Tax=Desertivirga brevis TaxID=2810310 RepID=UPI001A976504|nr:anthranilate phosphoribosyltransferase [Pedobacter sp. SYSU D00873]